MAAEVDPHVARLKRLFEEHPVWLAAARHVSPEATSAVRFRHRPGEEWTLAAEGDRPVLRPGRADDPDFAFEFTPGAIARLEASGGDVADFALTLFRLIESDDPEIGVGFEIVAPFARLAARGYVELLLAAGPRLLAFGLARGVASVGALRKRVERHRREHSRA
jgi:hypothetical protein